MSSRDAVPQPIEPVQGDAKLPQNPVADAAQELEREVERRAVEVILDHLDPPSPRLGRNDWCINVAKIVRALRERGLLIEQITPAPRDHPGDSRETCPEWNCPDLSTEDLREGKTCPEHPCTCAHHSSVLDPDED